MDIANVEISPCSIVDNEETMLNTQRSWIEALKDLVRATYRPVDGVRLLLEPDLPDRSHRGAALPHHHDHHDRYDGGSNG